MCSGNPVYEGFSKNIQENTVGYDFRYLDEQQLQAAQAVTADQLKYSTAEQIAAREAALQKEVDRRDAPRRLAEERKALIAQQEAQMRQYEQQLADQNAAQVAKVKELQGLQAERLQGIRSRGTAVTQSLRVLGERATTQAPTAAMSTPTSRFGGARSTTASLRMGTTGRGTGSGANVAV